MDLKNSKILKFTYYCGVTSFILMILGMTVFSIIDISYLGSLQIENIINMLFYAYCLCALILYLFVVYLSAVEHKLTFMRLLSLTFMIGISGYAYYWKQQQEIKG